MIFYRYIYQYICKIEILISIWTSILVFKIQGNGIMRLWDAFSVKSLSSKLDLSSPLSKDWFSALWKSNSPKRINILDRILQNNCLNTVEVHELMIPHSSLMLLFGVFVMKQGNFSIFYSLDAPSCFL